MTATVNSDFFVRPAETVARELIGTYLVRKREGQAERYMITETEAYIGPEDQACHARFGKTERTAVMYERGGTMYVYLIYGIYDMLNIVTNKKGFPAAVLIRGVESVNENPGEELDGPGKLTRDLDITKQKHDGKLLGPEAGIWIEPRDASFDPDEIEATPRIGIDYAGEWKDRPLRFVLEKKPD